MILVRHGETELNARGIYRGKSEVSLSARGRTQSRAVGRALRGIILDGIYTSPLERCQQTARIIAAGRWRTNVARADEFIDMDFGRWEGMTVLQVKKKFPKDFEMWVNQPRKARIGGGETLDRVRKRALAGLDRLYKVHTDGTIAIVSHGVVNKLILCSVLGLTSAGFWRVKQDTGAINVFEFTPWRAKLLLMNDRCHLGRIRDVVESIAESSTLAGASTDDERRYKKWQK